jgi:hypothetical protein
MAVGNYIFTDGGKFNQHYIIPRGLQILAANTSLWVPFQFANSTGEGFLLQIDHLDATTAVKYTRVMHCERMPLEKKEEDENCILIKANVSSKCCIFFTFNFVALGISF